MAVDYNRFFSRTAKRRTPDLIRSLLPLVSVPGMINLGGGIPNASNFPFRAITVELKDGPALRIEGKEMDEALQYIMSAGMPELVAELRRMQERIHKPKLPGDRWDLLVTAGSQDGVYKVLEAVIDEGDYIIIEEPTYGTTIGQLKALGANVICVATDNHGICVDALEEILANWPTTRPLPKALYVIPTAQNPSGTSLTLERKHRLLELASRYDLLIIEDDAYYFLLYPTTAFEFYPPSLFSLDTAGRVVRLDTLSKVFSAGMRLGWLAGPRPLLERIELCQQMTVQHASGLSQAVALATLRQWGPEGWDAHVARVRAAYKQRRDWLLEAAERHLSGLAEWTVPAGGMFLWIRCMGVADTHPMIRELGLNKQVVLVPGSVFLFPERVGETEWRQRPSQYVRAAYSLASKEQMDAAMERLAAMLREAAGG